MITRPYSQFASSSRIAPDSVDGFMELMKGMVLDQWSDPEINMGISKYGFGILYANQQHIGHPMVHYKWIQTKPTHTKININLMSPFGLSGLD